jgi:hypothetical protein
MIERRIRRFAASFWLVLSSAVASACGSGAASGGGKPSDAPPGTSPTTPGAASPPSGAQTNPTAMVGFDSGAAGVVVDAGGGSPGSSGAANNGAAGSGGAGSKAGGTDVDAESTGSTNVGAVPTDAGAAPEATAGAVVPQTFVCSQVMGLMLTDQWYTAGFETEPGIDDARWQLKWMDHAYIDEWANPNSTFWGIVPTSPCAQDSSSPDRVLLVALSWTLVTLADWETNVQKDVDNIKAKYPNVKQIVLMTIVRGPGNVSCGNTTVVAENTLIPSYVDQALADVAATSPDLVKVAPPFAANSCADFMGTGPHLTAAGDAEMAQKIAAAFANQ